MDSLDNFIKATGVVNIQLFDAAGNLKEERLVKNLVVSAGLTHIAGRMSNTGTPNQMSHMALGTSNTTPLAGDTALGAQQGSRKDLAVAGGTVEREVECLLGTSRDRGWCSSGGRCCGGTVDRWLRARG